jgi:hypothetical protein
MAVGVDHRLNAWPSSSLLCMFLLGSYLTTRSLVSDLRRVDTPVVYQCSVPLLVAGLHSSHNVSSVCTSRGNRLTPTCCCSRRRVLRALLLFHLGDSSIVGGCGIDLRLLAVVCCCLLVCNGLLPAHSGREYTCVCSSMLRPSAVDRIAGLFCIVRRDSVPAYQSYCCTGIYRLSSLLALSVVVEASPLKASLPCR